MFLISSKFKFCMTCWNHTIRTFVDVFQSFRRNLTILRSNPRIFFSEISFSEILAFFDLFFKIDSIILVLISIFFEEFKNIWYISDVCSVRTNLKFERTCMSFIHNFIKFFKIHESSGEMLNFPMKLTSFCQNNKFIVMIELLISEQKKDRN